MTAQMHDIILINEKVFSIVGVYGGELFKPQSVGITPFSVITSCWRGYVCQYKVSNDKLLLDELQVFTRMESVPTQEQTFVTQKAPSIKGVSPTGNHPIFNNFYEGVELEIPFTGNILAGDGFIQSLYVHMGFHPAWKYQTVLELTIDHGTVLGIRDISAQMEQLRGKMTEPSHVPDHPKSSIRKIAFRLKKKFRRNDRLKD